MVQKLNSIDFLRRKWRKFFYELCPAPSLEGNTPDGPVAHGVSQRTMDPFGISTLHVWENPVGKPHTKRSLSPVEELPYPKSILKILKADYAKAFTLPARF